MTTYSNYQTSMSWMRNTAVMLELKPYTEHPRVWRISETHNNYPSNSAYPREAYSPISRDGRTIYWGADWPGGDGTIDTYKVVLPAEWWVDLGGASPPDDTTTPPILTPSITLTKQAGQFQASSGDTLTYTIIYQNTSTVEAKNIIITDKIPEGTTYIANSVTNGEKYNLGANELTWTIPFLSAGASGQVSFQSKVD